MQMFRLARWSEVLIVQQFFLFIFFFLLIFNILVITILHGI